MKNKIQRIFCVEYIKSITDKFIHSDVVWEILIEIGMLFMNLVFGFKIIFLQIFYFYYLFSFLFLVQNFQAGQEFNL